MAINPSVKYAGNVTAPDSDYPFGSARNVSSPGAGDGTPLEQDWVNDWFGFQQAVLDESGIVPSGTPDKVGASQVLDGIIQAIGGSKLLSSTAITATSTIDLPSVISDNPGYRYYKVSVQGFAPPIGGGGLQARVSINGSTFRSTSGDYGWSYSRQNTDTSAMAFAQNNSDTKIDLGGLAGGNANGEVSVVFSNPSDSSQRKHIRFDRTNLGPGNEASRSIGVGGFFATNDAITGVQLLWSSPGAFAAAGEVKVYGSNAPF